MSFDPHTIDPSEANRVAMRYYHNPDKAADLVADTMARAWENRDKFDDSNARAWFYRLMRNLYINRFKRGKVADKHEIPDWGRDTTVSMPDTVRMSEVLASIEALPAHYRAVVELRARDFDYAEIADKLGIPSGTVMSRLFRARSMMKGE